MKSKEFLLEYSRQVTAENFGQPLLQVALKDKTAAPVLVGISMQQDENEHDRQVVDRLLTILEKSDPTVHKSYVPWLAKTYAQGQTKWEDITSRAVDALTKFDKLKAKKVLPINERDINQYTGLYQLENILRKYPDVGPALTNKGKAVEYYQDAQLRVIIPEDEDAAKYYGQGTTWCTAARKDCKFDTYNKHGKMYIIFPKVPSYTGEKYQFHFETRQFMNEQDKPVDLLVLVKRYPQLFKIFHEQARKNMVYKLLPNYEETKAAFAYIIRTFSAPQFYQALTGKIGNRLKVLEKDNTQEGLNIEQNVELISIVYETLRNKWQGLLQKLLSNIKLSDVEGNDAWFDFLVQEIEDWVMSSDIGDFIRVLENEHIEDTEDYTNKEPFDIYSIAMNIIHLILNQIDKWMFSYINYSMEPHVK